MNIFGAIMDKIFHHPAAQPAPAAAAEAQPAATQPAAATQAPAASAPAPSQPVDVEAGGGGNYDSSIVDLLKLLDLDSSLDARKQLAQELNVHVAADGSAEENIALHRAVMQKLAENGGKVPAGLS